MTALQNQTAIVTGGGSGIGKGIALALAEAGANVVLCGRRPAPLARVLDTIRQRGGSGISVQADVSGASDVDRLMQAALQTFGGLDILINNAGIAGGGRIHAHNIETWDRVMAVNLRGPFLTARAALAHMRAQRSGHIINISSESGIEYYPGNGAYGVAKHALNALGEFITRENQEHNIRVDTICPGMVISEMTETAPGLNMEKCLTAADIADLALWLLTRPPNVKIGTPVLIQTMENPWV